MNLSRPATPPARPLFSCPAWKSGKTSGLRARTIGSSPTARSATGTGGLRPGVEHAGKTRPGSEVPILRRSAAPLILLVLLASSPLFPEKPLIPASLGSVSPIGVAGPAGDQQMTMPVGAETR